MASKPAGPLSLLARAPLRDCSGAPVGPDEFFGILLHKAPQASFTARELRAHWEETRRDAPARGLGRLHGYMHLPFCASRCSYCHYYSEKIARSSQIDDYLERRLFPEMGFFSGAFAGAPLDHMAVGGGTPSLLSARQLERLMARFHACFALRPEGILIFECNPRSVTAAKMRQLRSLGVTRISIGVQSQDPATLARVNRGYQDEAMIARAVEAISAAGFRDGLNIDLIAGFAGEDADAFLRSFSAMARLGADSIHVNLLHAVGQHHPRSAAAATGAAEGVAAAPGERAALFAELSRCLPPLAERLGLVFRPLTGPLSLDDEDWCFARRDGAGALRPHSYGRSDEDDIRLPLFDNSVLALGTDGRSRISGRLAYWDHQTTAAAPFEPDAPVYQGWRPDPAFRPVWRRLIGLRERPPRARRVKAASPACLCQLGGCTAGDGRTLDLSETFEHTVAVERGAERLVFRLERQACAPPHPLRAAGGLAVRLVSGPAEPPELLALVAEAFAAVAGGRQARCLAETARRLQAELARRLGPDGAAKVLPAQSRSRLARPHVLKCLL